MLDTVFATKLAMSQAWTTAGKRLPITRCRVANNIVVTASSISSATSDQNLSENNNSDTQAKAFMLEIGYGEKKLKNMPKPLRSKLQQGGFSLGVLGMRGITVMQEAEKPAPKVGETIAVESVLEVGDIVKVQGTTKGRGFAGAIKRHGFSGGPKTHGQSDRERSVGSIGAGTSPGRVWKGKKMPGHYGVDTKTVAGLIVVYIDPKTQEVWLNGPVPGSINSIIRINKTGKTKQLELDRVASGLPEPKENIKEDTISESTESLQETQKATA